MASKQTFGLPIGCIVAGIAAVGLSLGLLAQSPHCGGGTMGSGDVCVSGDSSRTTSEVKSDNATTAHVGIGVGVVLAVIGVGMTITTATNNARIDEDTRQRTNLQFTQQPPQ
ncbi:hypothetical protein ACWDUL_20510 [Nocardia niigatensis]